MSKFLDKDKGLLARTLVKFHDKVPLRFMNLSDQTQTINQGTIVGQMSPVDDIIEPSSSDIISEPS